MIRVKYTYLTVLPVLVLLFQGCTRSGPPLEEGRFRLSVETLGDDAGSFVKRLTITTLREHTFNICHENMLEQVGMTIPVKKEPKTLLTAKVTVEARLVDSYQKERKLVILLVRLDSEDAESCNPECFVVPSGRNFQDLVSLTIKPGDYPIGKDIELGHLLGSALTLNVGDSADSTPDETRSLGVLCQLNEGLAVSDRSPLTDGHELLPEFPDVHRPGSEDSVVLKVLQDAGNPAGYTTDGEDGREHFGLDA